MNPKIPKHWPLTVQDIIQERTNKEDWYWHRNDPEPALPKHEHRTLTLTPTAIAVLGAQMVRKSISLMTP